MVSHRTRGMRTLCLIWQLALVALSYWAWLAIWQGTGLASRPSLAQYLVYNEFLLIGVLLSHDLRLLLPGSASGWTQANRRSLRQLGAGLFAVLLVVFATRDVSVSRSFLISYIPWLYLTLLFTNQIVPVLLARWSFAGDRQERVALVGSAEQAQILRPWLERKSLLGLRTVGIIAPSLAASGPTPFPVLGPLDQAEHILRASGLTQLIVLELSLGSEVLRRLTQLCESRAVRLLALNDLDAQFHHKTVTFEDDGVRFVGLREEPLESPTNRVAKRILDLAVAVPVVVVLLPVVTLIVWALQRWQSPGPIFFRQRRTGMMGRPFPMYKYRTMHLNHGSEARQASPDDVRVYPAGRWLRRLSLDELPQFLNVVTGEMSVVGPRPHLPEHDRLFVQAMGRYVIRELIRPGLTGWAQIQGYRGEVRAETDIRKRVEADIHYLENWSLSLDLWIICQTAWQCLVPPRSAY